MVDISRQPGKTFNNTIHVGYCPTLTTKNHRLHLISRRPALGHTKVPSVGHRAIRVIERSRLSGVVWESVCDIQTPTQLVTSFGNMIPVNLAGSVLQLIMDKWALWEDHLLRIGYPLASNSSSSSSASQAGSSGGQSSSESSRKTKRQTSMNLWVVRKKTTVVKTTVIEESTTDLR